MLIFKYCIVLKEGYQPATVYSDGEETEFEITIEAQNRATADRMVKAMLQGATNIVDIMGWCVSE